MSPFEPFHQHFCWVFQTHLDAPTAVGESVVAHGTEEAVEAGNAWNWLICHGKLQVVEKNTSPIDPIWVWEMVHFMIGRILMVNDMLRSFLLVFFFFGGGDGYRFAICYLRYVEWYIYIYMFFFFFALSEAKDMNSITHWGPVLLFGCQGDQRGIWWTVDGWHLRDTWNKLIPIRWSGKTCSWSSRWEDGGLLGLLLLLYKDNN